MRVQRRPFDKRQWTRAECKNFEQGRAGAAVGKLKRGEVKGYGEARKVSTDVGSATIDACESVRTGAGEPPVGGQCARGRNRHHGGKGRGCHLGVRRPLKRLPFNESHEIIKVG